jgi:hypothetical protein
MYDKFRKRHKLTPVSARLRHQIALEAARRMFDAVAPDGADDMGCLKEATENEYHTAKRKAAAVPAHRVRPGDLPSDSELRALARSRSGAAFRAADLPEPDDEAGVERLGGQVDRFAIYKMRLEPLEAIKQNPKHHSEGDALYHKSAGL